LIAEERHQGSVSKIDYLACGSGTIARSLQRIPSRIQVTRFVDRIGLSKQFERFINSIYLFRIFLERSTVKCFPCLSRMWARHRQMPIQMPRIKVEWWVYYSPAVSKSFAIAIKLWDREWSCIHPDRSMPPGIIRNFSVIPGLPMGQSDWVIMWFVLSRGNSAQNGAIWHFRVRSKEWKNRRRLSHVKMNRSHWVKTESELHHIPLIQSIWKQWTHSTSDQEPDRHFCNHLICLSVDSQFCCVEWFERFWCQEITEKGASSVDLETMTRSAEL